MQVVCYSHQVANINFILLWLLKVSDGIPQFTNVKEGSYGVGEKIQFFGQFTANDDNILKAGNFSVELFDIENRNSYRVNQVPLSCTVAHVDRFENGEDRPLTQVKYFQRYLNCNVPSELVHDTQYGLDFIYYDFKNEYHHQLYHHVHFKVT